MPASIRSLSCALGPCLLLGTTLACASTVLPELEIHSEADADDPRVKEVSTATRTATAVRDVPQTIDSIKTGDLTRYGVSDLAYALTGLPNVSDGADTRFDSLRIRGFDASYDFYLDGIRDDSQYKRDLHNIERIEVLKGPAAVLYGRGSQGGIVNRISKTPTVGQRSTLQAQGGSNDLRSLYADLNADAADTLSLRLNLGNEHRNSFRDGVSSDRQLFAPSMSWQLRPDLNWLLQYEYGRHQRIPDRGIPGVGGRPAKVSRATTYVADGSFSDDRTQSLRSRLSYALDDDWQLRHTLGIFRLDSDFDDTFLTGYNDQTGAVSRSRWQQDLTTRNLFNTIELEGRFDTGGLEHQVLTGVEVGRQRRDPTLYTVVKEGAGASGVPALELVNPDRRLRHIGKMALSANNHTVVESLGVYVQDHIRLNDQWQLLAGVRRDQFEVESLHAVKGLSATRASSSISPRLGAVWSPVPHHAFYASWTKSFSPVGGGLIGINPGASDNSNDLSPELTRQREIGLKSDWMDQRLSTTLAVYELELYNRKTQDPEDPNVILMTGLQRSRGLELTLTGTLADHWYIRAGLGMQRATVVKDTNGFEGKRVNNVAERNGSLFLTWKPAVGWYAESGLTLVGQRYADKHNTTTLPGYARWDASLGYREKGWDLGASLNNINDKVYHASATSASQIQPGAPRNLVVSATYNF